MKLFVSLLIAALVVDQCLADGGAHGGGARRQGRRQGGGRRRNQGGASARLRQGRQQQFAAAAQLPLGPPPQPPVLLDANSPLPIAPQAQARPALPVDPNIRQSPRGGRQFNADSDSSTFQGQTPDDDGNYAFQYATDDGQYRQETGRQVATADGDATEITGEVSWTDDVTGEVVSFTYTANENGYSAQGPLIPEHLQRGLDLIRRTSGLNF